MKHRKSIISLGERASNLFHMVVAGTFGLITLTVAFHMVAALA
jgi:hypothetical protein